MVIESLKIKTKSNYNWDDIVYVYDIDVKLTKVINWILYYHIHYYIIILHTCLIPNIKLIV